jgi:MFS family permease
LTSVLGFGVVTLVFAISKNYLLSAAALALIGAFDSISMVIRSAAVQLLSPDNMRGRISAVNTIFIGSSNELGAFESGLAAKLLGTVPSVIFGGIMCVMTVSVVAVACPKLRRLSLKQLEDEQQ